MTGMQKQKFCPCKTKSDSKAKSSSSGKAGLSQSPQDVSSQLLLQQLLLKGVKGQYKNHFVTALSVVLKERSLSDFEYLIELQAKNGVKFVSGKNNNKSLQRDDKLPFNGHE